MATETEMRLLLPDGDDPALVERLERVPVLARSGPATVHDIFTRYYDTPGGDLARLGVSLRVRRVDGRWEQTLKATGAPARQVGWSVREEWAWPLANARLSLGRLRQLPEWRAIDPEGVWLAALRPACVARFERRCWTVHRRGGAVVEVALDRGELRVGLAQLPLRQLELELKAGRPDAVPAIARAIARRVAVLPGAPSKPERGAALAGRGSAGGASAAGSLGEAEACSPAGVLVANFGDFVNKITKIHDIVHERPVKCITVEAPVEVVHEARVAWRRFASTLRFFRPRLPADPRRDAAIAALGPLREALGALRDLDVAIGGTLPSMERDCVAGVGGVAPAGRQRLWNELMRRLEAQRLDARARLHEALCRPATGGALLDLLEGLERCRDAEGAEGGAKGSAQWSAWARRRLRRMEARLARLGRLAFPPAAATEAQHRLRIAAKRVRYVLESLPGLKGARRCARRLAELRDLQTRIGAARDRAQALRLLAQWPELADLADLTELRAAASVELQA